MSEIVPFTINVPDALLEETRVKLKYARLDDAMVSVEWDDLEIGHTAFMELVQFWRDECDWKNYECFLNTFHHFKTTIQVPGFEALGIHFTLPSVIEARRPPGSFLEVPKKSPQKFIRFQNKDYDERDLKNMERIIWFAAHERGYQIIQETKCVTLGYGLHDSPVTILAWFVGKLKAWTDDYPRTMEELINWTFMHYQGSPSAAMQIYKEALAVVNDDPDSMAKRYVSQPVGGSVFPKELWMSPRERMEKTYNIQFWRQKDKGGHFAAWEQPETLVNDLRDFSAAEGPVFGKH
ncbi:hypothetical protein ACHAQF_000092 [Verticillium nonalfalfae]